MLFVVVRYDVLLVVVYCSVSCAVRYLMMELGLVCSVLFVLCRVALSCLLCVVCPVLFVLRCLFYVVSSGLFTMCCLCCGNCYDVFVLLGVGCV